MKEFKKSRRNFINKAIAVGGVGIVAPSLVFTAKGNSIGVKEEQEYQRPKVLFFDVNETLLDLNAMKKSIGNALGGRPDLVSLWFTTMLQYSLVTTVGNQYHDFGKIGGAALKMVGLNNGVVITDEQAGEAIKPILSLPAHPEVKEALILLKKEGYTLVSFTNSSNKAVESQLKNAGIYDLFDDRLSIEDVGKFKPHYDAYNWAARKMGFESKDCMLIAAHGWDVAGANWAGWQTAFVSRPGQQLFALANPPEINDKDLLLIAKQLVKL